MLNVQHFHKVFLIAAYAKVEAVYLLKVLLQQRVSSAAVAACAEAHYRSK